jgi:Ca-activated chloride channel family protein
MSRLRTYLALLASVLLLVSCADLPPPDSPAQPEAPAAGPPPEPEPPPPDAPDSVAQLPAAASRGLDVMTAPGELPSLKVAGDASKVVLKKTDVDASITGLVADVEVRQTYENHFTVPIETTYVFPLPENAAVYRMTMVIGDRKIEAVVKEREAAKRTYEAAKTAGHTAALLEQERPNVFTQSVANIEPGKAIEIVVRYVQDLAYDEGQVEMVFPMVVGPRFVPGAPKGTPPSGTGTKPDTTAVPDASRISPPILGDGERTGNDISLAVTVNGASALSDVETPTHAVTTSTTPDGAYRVALSPKDKIPNRDFILRYRVAGEKAAATLYQSGADSGYFSLVLHPPALPLDQLVGRREVVFVVDISGSMSGQPLSLCKQAMREALSQLRPADTFNVVTFASGTNRLFPKARRATQDTVREARSFVDRMKAGGGTYMADAVAEALTPDVEKGRDRYVLFLTDGYVGNEQQILDSTDRLVRDMEARGQKARVFGFGVGGSPNRFLMDGLVRKGRGVAVSATTREDPTRAVNRFFRYIDRSVVRDLTIDFGGLAATDVMPKVLPDLFASRAVVVHGRFTGKPKGPIVVRGKGAGGDVQIPVRVARGPAADGWPILALLWARSKITWLDDGLSEDAGARAEITKLGIDYHLVTAFTSFVAVDESKVVGKGAPAHVTVPVEVPEGVDANMGGAEALAVAANPAGGVQGDYAYEFSDDPLASGGFGPNDATIRVRPGPVYAVQQIYAPPQASRSARGCYCGLAGEPPSAAAPWLALGLASLLAARRSRRGRGLTGTSCGGAPRRPSRPRAPSSARPGSSPCSGRDRAPSA